MTFWATPRDILLADEDDDADVAAAAVVRWLLLQLYLHQHGDCSADSTCSP